MSDRMDGSLTVKQLAERWGFCSLTIRQMEKAGKVRGFRLGRNLRFRLEEVVKAEGGTAESSEIGIGDDELTKITREAEILDKRVAIAKSKWELETTAARVSVAKLEEREQALGETLLEIERLMDNLAGIKKRLNLQFGQEFIERWNELAVYVNQKLGKDDRQENTSEGVE